MSTLLYLGDIKLVLVRWVGCPVTEVTIRLAEACPTVGFPVAELRVDEVPVVWLPVTEIAVAEVPVTANVAEICAATGTWLPAGVVLPAITVVTPGI